MGPFKHPVFDPLELEIIHLVCEAAWAEIQARKPKRDTEDASFDISLAKRLQPSCYDSEATASFPDGSTRRWVRFPSSPCRTTDLPSSKRNGIDWPSFPRGISVASFERHNTG